MGFEELIYQKFGCNLIRIVESYSNNLTYTNSSIKPNSKGVSIVESMNKKSPFERINTYFIAEKNGKLSFCYIEYFGAFDTILVTPDLEEPQVIIDDIDIDIYERFFKKSKNLKHILFTKGNSIIGYNFYTKKVFEFKDIGKFINIYEDRILLLNSKGLEIYKIIDNKDFKEIKDYTKLSFEELVYKDEKKIVNCTQIEVTNPSCSIDADIYKLDFDDDTTRLLLAADNGNLMLTKYYKKLIFEETCIFPSIKYMGKEETKVSTELTFEYYDGIRNGELVIDSDFNITHREKVFVK